MVNVCNDNFIKYWYTDNIIDCNIQSNLLNSYQQNKINEIQNTEEMIDYYNFEENKKLNYNNKRTINIDKYNNEEHISRNTKIIKHYLTNQTSRNINKSKYYNNEISNSRSSNVQETNKYKMLSKKFGKNY